VFSVFRSATFVTMTVPAAPWSHLVGEFRIQCQELCRLFLAESVLLYHALRAVLHHFRFVPLAMSVSLRLLCYCIRTYCYCGYQSQNHPFHLVLPFLFIGLYLLLIVLSCATIIMTLTGDKSLTCVQKIVVLFSEMTFFYYLCHKFSNKMRFLSFFLFMLLSLLTACSSCNKQTESDTPPTQELLITQIQECSRLYTAEYQIHKIVTHDDVLRLQGQLTGERYDFELPMLGDRKIAIPMEATLKAYIDFGGFSEANVERDGDRITIVLPDPKVVLTSSKIDHANIKKYVALLRRDFTDQELSAYEQQGREAIIATIPELGIVESARQNAARILVPMIKQLGYSERNITIAFRHDLDPQSIIERNKE
jgi:hypothetical protein